jgi:hypothetical protein
MLTSRSRLLLKSLCLVQDLQPQYAAYLAITAAARHVIPTAGDHVLTVDVGGGLQAEQAINDLLSSEKIVSGDIACERVGSTLELLSGDIQNLETISASLTNGEASEVEVTDSLLLENVSFDYANLVNRSRKGALVIMGDSLLTLECNPADQVGKMANQIEARHPSATLVNIDIRSGRLTLKGPASLLQSIQAG